MDKYLYKYLVLHKHLCIPQLGSFAIQKDHARYEEASGQLYPPSETIVFSNGVIPMSEKLFFDFLANEMGVDEVTAIKQFHDFSYGFRNQLLENGSVGLEGVGRLEKLENGSIVFEAAPRLTGLMPPLHDDGSPVPVIESAGMEEETILEEEEETEKDNWGVYALILLLLGAGALLFYYYS